MKVTVIGLGLVGTVAAVCLADSGHEVLATDIDSLKVRALSAGEYKGYEPGLASSLKSALAGGNLRFRHSEGVDEDLGRVALVAVGTPSGENYAPDLSQVRSAIHWVKDRSNGSLMVAMKSTVPPGTGLQIVQQDLNGTGIGYAANPEFLRAGQAMADWDCPDRIVIGTASRDPQSGNVLKELYSRIDAPVLATDVTTAEMIKYASNAFLATRISFINDMAAICDHVGASIDDVSRGLALDARTGARIFPGVGYGGPCLPKYIGALKHIAQQTGGDSQLLRAVTKVNELQWRLPLKVLHNRFSGNMEGTRVGILGLAFKPETDDLTEAPALNLASALAAEGVQLTVFDPALGNDVNAGLLLDAQIVPSVVAASAGAQAVVVMTEWREIVEADWDAVSRIMASPRFVFDGRNALDSKVITAAGLEYQGVGRNVVLRPHHGAKPGDERVYG